MRVLFTIFGYKASIGGHFQSLVTIAKAMSVDIHVEILCISENRSPIIDNSKITNFHINSRQKDNVIRNQASDIWKKGRFDCIHCFDFISFYYVKKLTKSILLTKCGGENIKFFPPTKYISVFSLENLEFFNTKKKFLNSKIWLIPNRVAKFSQNYKLIKEIRKELAISSDDVVFLKISRISKYYKDSIYQTINLCKELSSKHENLKFILIGVIQDRVFYENILKEIKGLFNFFVLTDKDYISNPKQLIGICDIYIGSGRSVMEAAFVRKVLAGHSAQGSFPVLINEHNLTNFLEKNFSERVYDSKSDEDRIEDFNDLLQREKKTMLHKEFSESLFNQYFNVETSIGKYIQIYKLLMEEDKRLLSPYQNFIFSVFMRYKLLQRFGLMRAIFP